MEIAEEKSLRSYRIYIVILIFQSPKAIRLPWRCSAPSDVYGVRKHSYTWWGDVRGYREGMAMETQTEPQHQVPQLKAEPVNPLQLPERVLLPTFAVS